MSRDTRVFSSTVARWFPLSLKIDTFKHTLSPTSRRPRESFNDGTVANIFTVKLPSFIELFAYLHISLGMLSEEIILNLSKISV